MPRPKSKSKAREEPPAKRTKLLDDGENSNSDTDNDFANGVILPKGTKDASKDEGGFAINEEYARRFEYNKKREEKERLEEKYKEDDSDSSTSEEEDDLGELATQELDSEIFATLNAIRSKDPRVYDSKATFYRPFEEDDANVEVTEKKEKPIYLRDYHRENLLNGNVGGEEDEEPPQTYAQEQEALRRSTVGQMHAAADEENGDDNDFLVKKSKSAHDDMAVPVRKAKRKAVAIEDAEKDPETFLSNFMAARAWVPEDEARFQAMDSDDTDEEGRAEAWEAAYNLRFEDPKASNEKLMSFARDAGKRSARREELSGRKKQREQERMFKEAIKQERREEKARLRRLKIEEVEQKVKLIREAAGLKPQEVLDLDEWSKVLEEDWDDERWQKEIETRFGDNYYAEPDTGVEGADDDAAESKKTKKPKKPKWDDDIDVKDLIPDFEDDDEDAKPDFTLSDMEDDEENTVPTAANGDGDEAGSDADSEDASAPAKKKDHERDLADKKRASRKQRRAIEDLVDNQLTTEIIPSSSKNPKAAQATFRYREASPSSFGLTPRDILFADDSQLNQYAGLKKMAVFRDEEKKRRDRKNLGKKARLRQWRKETFGNEEGYAGTFADFVGEKTGGGYEQFRASEQQREVKDVNGTESGGREKKKKRKRKGAAS